MGNAKVKAQVALEFTTAFICLVLFLVATTKIFVWFGNNIVQRHKAYEDSRSGQVMTDTAIYQDTPVPPTYFYDQSKHQLDIFGKQ